MPARAGSASWKGEPLPRGRHNLSAGEVASSQRARLLRAMLECVAEHGYEATTVPMVVATARVSRNGFYSQFEDKLDCFLALCDRLGALFIEELGHLRDVSSWREALDLSLGLYLRTLADEPAIARAWLVEIPSAGPRAVEHRARTRSVTERALVALAERIRVEEPGPLAPLRPLAARMAVGGVTEIIAAEVREGRTAEVQQLACQLTELIVALLAEPAAR